MNLPALIWAFIAEDLKPIPFVEAQCQAKILAVDRFNYLAEQSVYKQWSGAIFIRIVAVDNALSVNVMQLAFNVDTTFVEVKLELPPP